MTRPEFERHVEWLADELVTVRDFCGDARQCLREYLAEHAAGWSRAERAALVDKAAARAEELWRESQRAAGVKRPIHPSERAKIERALEVQA